MLPSLISGQSQPNPPGEPVPVTGGLRRGPIKVLSLCAAVDNRMPLSMDFGLHLRLRAARPSASQVDKGKGIEYHKGQNAIA